MAVASSDPAHSPTAVHEWPVEGMGGGGRGGEGDFTCEGGFYFAFGHTLEKQQFQN